MDAKDALSGGTGARLGKIVVTLTGVCTLVSILLTVLSIWLQLKNYRKPFLQRYVVRILLLVPFFSGASWASLVSLSASRWIEPFRDVYEAFVIYAFFQLLINFIGGERDLLIITHGRAPISHLWPLSHVLPKVDISDPHTFLAIKRGILQYTWVKPLLAIATIVMKATDTYEGGYTSVTSGYFWSGIFYNISITVSLYALAMFWVCMSQDLQPFRPMPKFLCIKGIIFASYWQGFMLSILVAMKAITDKVPGYTPDNLAAAIQDALICFEMPIFTMMQWYAFSWKDYADVTVTSARMPVKYALRDAFGTVDLVQDAKETFAGNKYEYRAFDGGENVLAHEESRQRAARMMEGMRYERGGKGKYWIPKPGQGADSKTPLLSSDRDSSRNRSVSHDRGSGRNERKYGTTEDDEMGDPVLNEDDERLYANARALEFGDWNYPVITAHIPSREDRLYAKPRIVTNATNRHVIQPTTTNRFRRKSRIADIKDSADQGKQSDGHRDGEGSRSRSKGKSALRNWLRRDDSDEPPPDGKTDKSQLRDLVIEDHEAEAIERVRARKEGSPEWNRHEPKHFVKTFPDNANEEAVREGFEPAGEGNRKATQQHTVDRSFDIGSDDDDDDQQPTPGADEADHWKRHDFSEPEASNSNSSAQYTYETEETNVWQSPKR